jgi:hypothetical protein
MTRQALDNRSGAARVKRLEIDELVVHRLTLPASDREDRETN